MARSSMFLDEVNAVDVYAPGIRFGSKGKFIDTVTASNAMDLGQWYDYLRRRRYPSGMYLVPNTKKKHTVVALPKKFHSFRSLNFAQALAQAADAPSDQAKRLREYARWAEQNTSGLSYDRALARKNPRKRRTKKSRRNPITLDEGRIGHHTGRAIAGAKRGVGRFLRGVHQGYKSHTKNPAGRPLTPKSKHVVIAALQRSNLDVGYFNGKAFVSDRKAVLLYPSSLVAKHIADKLHVRPKDVTIVYMPASMTAAQLREQLCGVKSNPLNRGEVSRAARRFERFTGHRAGKVTQTKIKIPDTGYLLGPVHGITYKATRDDDTSLYHHEFKAGSRPSLVAASDGSSLVIAGGRYHITDRGIVDK